MYCQNEATLVDVRTLEIGNFHKAHHIHGLCDTSHSLIILSVSVILDGVTNMPNIPQNRHSVFVFLPAPTSGKKQKQSPLVPPNSQVFLQIATF